MCVKAFILNSNGQEAEEYRIYSGTREQRVYPVSQVAEMAADIVISWP